MSYLSSVRMIMPIEAYDDFKKHVKEYLSETGHVGDETYDLTTKTDFLGKDLDADELCLGWDDIKWYTDDFDDVDAVMHALYSIVKDGYSASYTRFGEDYEEGDIERDYWRGKDGNMVSVPYMSLTFDDSRYETD